MKQTIKPTDPQNARDQYGQTELTKRAFLMIAANIVAAALSLALPLALVRVMDQSEYGLYRQSFVIMTSALGILNLQVAVSIYYFMAREPGKKLQVAHNVILFYGMVGALVCLVFLFWPGWAGLVFQGGELVPHIPLLGLAILSWLVSTNLESVPIAAGDVRVAVVLTVASQLTRAVMLILAALLFGSLDAILLAAALAGAAQFLLTAYYIRRRFGRFFAPIDWPLFRRQIGNALPFGVGGIVAIVQNDMHNYFVGHFFDPTAFAIYAIGCFQLPMLGMLSASFASVLNPELAKHKEADNHRAIIVLWMDVMRKLCFFFVPAFALLLVLRREFMTALFTENYAASTPIFAVNLLTMLLGITVHLHLLRLFDELKYFRLKLYLALIPVTFGALYAGLLTGGLLGVAVAAICVQMLDAGITLMMIARQLKMTRRDLRALGPCARIGAAALVAAMAALAVNLALAGQPPLARLLLGGGVFGLVYLIAIFAARAVTREEQAQARAMLSSYYHRWIARKPSSGVHSPLATAGRTDSASERAHS